MASALPTLEKSKFVKKLHLLAIRVPTGKVRPFMNQLRGDVLNMRRVKHLVDDHRADAAGDEGRQRHKLLLLDPKYSKTDLSEMPQDRRRWIRDQLDTQEDTPVTDDVEKQEDGMAVPYELTLTYNDLTAEEVLREVLPRGCEVPSSFESVGHIAHMNIKEELMPYRFIIGQVILDKNPSIKTVVNKLGIIESQFREFKMEVIAGEENFDVEVKEHGITFRFNYSQVYWNSRLSSEHQRVQKYFSREDTVCDMFAGVGPFAIPAAKRVGCRILANDLNPKSFESMIQNVKLNRVSNLVQCSNEDGREFVKRLVREGTVFHHVLMNLPGSATDFLDVFVGLYRMHPKYRSSLDVSNASESTTTSSSSSLPSDCAIVLPMVHCYTFIKYEAGDDSAQMARERVAHMLSTSVTLLDFVDVHYVRNVAPTKDMFCVSFRLPPSVAFGGVAVSDESMERDTKRLKTEQKSS